ncbi:MAG TPA: alpha/beta hydrolase [Burkholderiales bacterium]|nr:alpha/beta hydrolase [Burkholderiales bacterium]
MHSRFLKRAGEPDLHYVVDDYTDPWRNAPYLILQHGSGRSSGIWRSWVPYLSRYYKVVRPDARGLGLSSAAFDLERDLTLSACVGDIAAIIDALGADSAHFCGESFGGILGMALAATHPRRVRTLTLVASPVRINPDVKTTYAAGHASRAEAVKEMGMKAWLENTNRSTRFPPDADPGLIAWYNEEYLRNRPEVQLAVARMVGEADAASYLPRIEAPVLGLYPTAGPITNEEQERTLAAGIRNLRMVHLPTSFHKVQLLFPAACTSHLLDFISQHDGSICREN